MAKEFSNNCKEKINDCPKAHPGNQITVNQNFWSVNILADKLIDYGRMSFFYCE